MPQFKTLFVSGALLVAFVIGGGKAGLDYWLHDTFKQTAQTLAQQQQLYLQTHTIRFTLPAALQLQKMEIGTPHIPPIRIEQVILQPLYNVLNSQQLPAFFSVNASGLTLPIPDKTVLPPVILMATGYDRYFLTPAELHQLGYQQLQGEFELTVQGTGTEFTLSAVLNAYAWGQWSLTIDLDQMPPPAEWTTAKLNQARLVGLRLHYQDRGLITRLLQFIAQREQMELTRLQNRLLGQLRQDLTRSGAPPFVLQSLMQLIQQPEALTLSLTPPTPLPLGRINGLPAGQMVEQLGFLLES